MVTTKNIDAFIRQHIQTRNRLIDSDILIDVNENTYLPDNELMTGWLPTVLSSFQDMNCKKTDSIVIVGIGPGVEALSFIEHLNPETLYCLDIHPNVIDIAKANITRSIKSDTKLHLIVEQSNLLGFIKDQKIKADLIYENLPNIKINAPLSLGTSTASFYNETQGDVLGPFEKYMLGLHYNFLVQAKQCLSANGKVICCIGARVPIQIIRSMFHQLGFSFDIVHIGIVEQLNTFQVVSAYKELEEIEDVEFNFFRHEDLARTKALVAEFNESDKSADEQDELYSNLQELSITASFASLNGSRVDHVGLIVEGSLKNQD